MARAQNRTRGLTALERLRSDLKPNAVDWATDLAKAAAELVPGIGPLFAFAIDLRPATQLKRVVTYLECLHDFVVRTKGDLAALQGNFEERPEAASIFYIGILAAAAATSEHRIKRLAAVASVGLTADETTAMNTARMLKVLAEIDDGEFVVLTVVEEERRIFLRYDSDHLWKEDEAASVATTGQTVDAPELPATLLDWSVADLSLALNHLAGLGLIEGEASRASNTKKVVFRSFVATPAGRHLVQLCQSG